MADACKFAGTIDLKLFVSVIKDTELPQMAGRAWISMNVLVTWATVLSNASTQKDPTCACVQLASNSELMKNPVTKFRNVWTFIIQEYILKWLTVA